jgi:hypothetical protein
MMLSPSVARADYWNLLNTGTEAGFYRFATPGDMMLNVNPTAIWQTPGVFATDIVGTGSDRHTYWNLFNNGSVAGFCTYATLSYMMLNTNPTAIVQTPGRFATYIVGTDADILPPTEVVPGRPWAWWASACWRLRRCGDSPAAGWEALP